jgi:hypothetical protein
MSRLIAVALAGVVLGWAAQAGACTYDQTASKEQKVVVNSGTLPMTPMPATPQTTSPETKTGG